MVIFAREKIRVWGGGGLLVCKVEKQRFDFCEYD